VRASSSRRYALALATGVAGALAFPAPALAHGIVAREDLPIPRWLFVAAAGTVLIVSFLALAVLWPQPQLETGHWRALPGAPTRLGGRGPEILGGALGAFVLAVVVWSGFDGSQLVTDNFAPTFVYVILWVGLVFASVLFGDVFRMLNPWRAVARAVAWIAGRLARGRLPAPGPLPVVARPLARGGRHRRLRVARARLPAGSAAGSAGDRHLSLLRAHLGGHELLRDRDVARAR